MPMGPVEYIVVGFPENRFDGTIIPALADLVEQGLVKILDLVFIAKDEEGNVVGFEYEDMPGEVAAFADLEGEAGSLLSDEDVEAVAEILDPGTSAALLVWEDVWAGPFQEAVRRCGGELITGGRVPAAVVDIALAAVDG
jgi:Family of unknown function (DUF6325)